MKTIKLVNKQRVRIPGDSWVNSLTFYVADYEEAPLGVIAFVVNPGVCITADYSGKEDVMNRDKAEYEASPLIEEGDIVTVDGIEHTFIAHINGIKYSDPVSFQAR